MELCFCILQLQPDYYLHKSGFDFTHSSGGMDGDELVEIAKLMVLIRGRTLFNADKKPFIDFLHEILKNEIMKYGFIRKK